MQINPYKQPTPDAEGCTFWICKNTAEQCDDQCLMLGYLIASCTFCEQYDAFHRCGFCRFFDGKCHYPNVPD